MFCFAADKDK